MLRGDMLDFEQYRRAIMLSSISAATVVETPGVPVSMVTAP